MTTVTLNEELQARFQAIATPDEDWNRFVADATQELIERREREAKRWAAARAEAQAILNGPRRPLAEANTEFKRRHNLRDLSHLSDEELAQTAERTVAEMDPHLRADLEREGLL
ncbi:MAG: hypothetical protein M3Y28_02275 [Armatimonadota bacterium]|nr:hypothetical protein [Armatimonadota bacterium]